MFDDMFEGMKISATAISAERKRMNLIANNLANLQTTAGPDEEPYKRKIAVFQTLVAQGTAKPGEFKGRGVKISQVVEDPRPPKLVYKPGHPHADKNGYVKMPNVDMVEENVDLIAATRAYDVNLTAMKNSRDMVQKIVELMTS